MEGIGSEVYLIWFRSPENQQMMEGQGTVSRSEESRRRLSSLGEESK